MLKTSADVARRLLSRADLLPLLQSSSQEVRLETIAVLNEFPAEPDPEDRTVTGPSL